MNISMANEMSIEDAVKKVQGIMHDAAVHFAKDREERVYTTALHVEAAGTAMRMVFAPKKEDAPRLAPTTANYCALFHVLYNQSAWRQKWESDDYKLFAKAGKRSLATFEDKLAEEVGEEE